MSSRASSTSTPIPSTPKTRPGRESRFTEGLPVTGPEILSQDAPSNELFFTILQQMDEHERKRKHRDSNSSVESFTSRFTYSLSPRSSAEKVNMRATPSPREARRSVNFGRGSMELMMRRSMDERPSEKEVKGFKGRLRALTGGQRERNVKQYAGT